MMCCEYLGSESEPDGVDLLTDGPQTIDKDVSDSGVCPSGRFCVRWD